MCSIWATVGRIASLLTVLLGGCRSTRARPGHGCVGEQTSALPPVLQKPGRERAGSGNRHACLAEPVGARSSASIGRTMVSMRRTGLGGLWSMSPLCSSLPKAPVCFFPGSGAPQPVPHRQPVRKPVRSRPAQPAPLDPRDRPDARHHSGERTRIRGRSAREGPQAPTSVERSAAHDLHVEKRRR